MVDGQELRAALEARKQRRFGAGHEGLAAEFLAGSRTAPPAGRRRDAPRSRRAAGSARCPTSRRKAWHATARCRPAAPSARRSSRVPPASPWGGGVPGGPSGAGPPACGRRRGRAPVPRQAPGGTSPRSRPRGSCPISASSVPERLRSACGKGPLSGSFSIIAISSRTISARAAAIATPVSAIWASIASNQARSRELLGKQPVAAAHRLFVVQRPLAVTRIDRQHQPVEEAPAVAGRPGEQRIHGRRQPHDAQPFEQVVGRFRALR